jgi:hypothetical protein
MRNPFRAGNIQWWIEPDNLFYQRDKFVLRVGDDFYSVSFPISTHFILGRYRGDLSQFILRFHSDWIGKDDSFKIPF